jgi:4-amino-4-deoxy-L-arabinose transferase-like glycosyltransferase
VTRRRVTKTSRTLIVAQLAALLVLGAVVTWRQNVWAPTDERAHYDYVQKLVEEGRIPRPTDLVSPEVQAITLKTYPEPSPVPAEAISLGGRSYEAIQPPLYYVMAAPAWMLPVDHLAKVYVLRVFDLALMVLAIWLLWRLSRRLAGPDGAPGAFALALAVLLWPGLVMRGVTVGNTPLEYVLVAATLLALWRADREPARRAPLATAAVLLGLALLTKLALVYLVPGFLIVLARRLRARGVGVRTLAEAAAAAVVPVVMLAPWLAMNRSRYGAWTVNIEGSPGVVGQVAPSGLLDRIAGLPERNWRMVDGVLPQEFWEQLDVWWVQGVVAGLGAALALGALAALVAARRDWAVWFLCLPALAGLAVANATYLFTGTEPFLLRYLYAALPPLAMGIGLGAHRALAAGARHHVVTAAGVASLLAAALWVDMAGAFYFTDVGAALGI